MLVNYDTSVIRFAAGNYRPRVMILDPRKRNGLKRYFLHDLVAPNSILSFVDDFESNRLKNVKQN